MIDAAARLWCLDGRAEITLEANPTSAEAGDFAGYRAAGVNRVSVGVQALDDAALKALGRQHTASEALAAFRLAAAFSRRSPSISSMPGPVRRRWLAGRAGAGVGRAQGHMSLYQLTIEPGTAFAGLAATGGLRVPDEATAAALYETTQEMTAAAGLGAYEISNHAAAGHACRHNLVYWRYGDYAGVGPGAHSRLTTAGRRRALAGERHPETWLRLVRDGGHGVIEDETLSAADQATERLLMGLRLAEGVPGAALAAAGVRPQRLSELAAAGLVMVSAERVAATAAGRQLLDGVIRELLRDAIPPEG